MLLQGRLKAAINARKTLFAFLATALLNLAPISRAALADVPADAKPAKIAAEMFARPAEFEWPAIAPDGKHLAYSERIGEDQFVSIAPLDNTAQKTQTALPKSHRLNWVRWAGSDKLIVSMKAPVDFFGERAWTSFLVSFDINTQKMNKLSRDGQGLIADDVIFVDPAGKYVLLSIAPEAIGEPKVFRIDLDTGDLTEAANNRPYVRNWTSDHLGNVRLGLGYADKSDVVYYRRADEKSFRRIKGSDKMSPEALIEWKEGLGEGDEGYALVSLPNGPTTLNRYNYERSTIGEIVLAKDKFDITSFALKRGSVALDFARYDDIKRRTIWFDPMLTAVQKNLEQSLPGQNVIITSRADDNSKMIVHASSPDDPGSYYLYESEGPKLHRFGGFNDDIDPAQMGETRAVQYAARDGLIIPGYLTVPRGREAKMLPLIIIPHDGPMNSRDLWQFDGMVQMLANRGYVVLQPNFRGSSGYGDTFSKAGVGQIGRAMQDDLDDGMDWLAKQGIIDPARVCIVGRGYGGYAAIWSVMRNPERYRCAATFAPITSINGTLDKRPDWLNDRFNRGWRLFMRMRDKGEEIYDKRFDEVSPAKSGKKLTRPVFVAYHKWHLDQKDDLVDFENAAGKDAKLIETLVFDDKDVLNLEQDEKERAWFERVDEFIARHNPVDIVPTRPAP